MTRYSTSAHMTSLYMSAAACALLAAAPGGAQDSGETADAAAPDVIVVTSQRREQTILEVPISLTVFDSAQIESSGWSGARDYIQLTPNVFFNENDQQGTKNGDISIRGISDLTSGGNERLIQTRSAIGFYVDDFSVSSVASGSANPPLNDVERIEILRGPQSTYFGRNATGGAINVVTKKPNDERMIRVNAQAGNFGAYGAGAIANAPLAEDLFVRGGVSWEQSDGFVDNLHPTGNDADWENLNARAALRWQPSDFTIDLTAQYTSEEQGNLGRIPTGVNPGGFLFGPTQGFASDFATCGLGESIFATDDGGNDDQICENADTFTEIDNLLLTGRVEYVGDGFTLTSITGYIDSDFGQFEDLDNSGADAFNRLNDYTSESFSQELRISSADDRFSLGGAGLNWTAGVYYYNDDFQVNNRIVTGADAAPSYVGFLTVPGDRPNENQQAVERTGYAVFGDISLDISDRLTASFGGRFSSDEDEQEWTNTFATFDCGTRAVVDGVAADFLEGCTPSPDVDPSAVFDDGAGNLFTSGGRFAQDLFTQASTDNENFSGRFALNWEVDDANTVFFTVSQGYRPAGVRVAPDALSRTQAIGQDLAPDSRSFFDEETVINYELGWRGFLHGGRTFIEASLFNMVWSDMQVRLERTLCLLDSGEFVPLDSLDASQCPGAFTPDNSVGNAPKARSRGVEFTVQNQLTDVLQIGGSGGFLDAEFTEFPNAPGGLGNLAGVRLPNSPKWSGLIYGQADWSSGGVDWFGRVEATHKSETVAAFNNVLATEWPLLGDSRTLVNLRGGFTWQDNEVTVSVDNVFDEVYAAGIDDFTALGAVILPHPRVIRVSWNRTFSY